MMFRGLFRQGWSYFDLVILLGLIAAALASRQGAWEDILRTALRDEEASHILLVPAVAAWLAWLRRARIRLCRPGHRWVGPVVAAVGLIVSMAGLATAIDVAWHGGAVLALIGAVLTITGTDVVRHFFPCLLVLIFLVPVPGLARQELSVPLQNWTATATQFVLELGGVLVERTGNVIVIDDMPIAVAEACNGMRMAFALTLVTYAFAFSVPMRNFARAVILIASPLLAVGFNVIRLVPTVMMYAWGPQDTADAFHDISGWLMLPVAFFGLMYLEQLLRWAMIPTFRFTLATRAP